MPDDCRSMRLNMKMSNINFFKNTFLKKKLLYFGLFKNLKTALTKSAKTISKLSNSKTTKRTIKSKIKAIDVKRN